MSAPSAEFLAELARRAKAYGWDGDYHEIQEFVEALYGEADIEPPNLEPDES